MSILLETTLGDLVIDLDVDGSPALCKNILKLCKVRYYTENLVYNVQPNRFFQLGDPRGDGIGGACIYGVLDAYDTARKIKINNAAQQKQNQKQNNSTKPNVMLSKRRFLKSDMGRPLTENECQQRGMVVATELGGIADTIGSQLLITIADGPDRALDGFRNNHNNNSSSSSNNNNLTTTTSSNEPLTAQIFRSVGTVVEDDNDVLTKMNSAYCDANGRPYADVRVIRALVIDDPFDDPTGMDQLLVDRGVTVVKVKVNNDDDNNNDDDDDDDGNKQMDDDDDDDEIMYKVMASPEYERPPEEIVETRIRADQIDDDNADDEIDLEKIRKQEEERYKREDKSRAVVLEMLGDLPSADMTAPENVLFVCKLNPVTEDDDLDLIFSRFDEKVKADIVRDSKTGASLQYAFVEFTSKERATEAYFKMNNALVDDRRIKVDFSQSVSKVWDKFNQVKRRGSSSTDRKNNNNNVMPRDPFKEQKLPLGRPHQHQQQQQQQKQKQAPRRDNRSGNSNNMSNEQRRGGNSSNDHNQRHHYQREDIHHSSSNNRERNRDRNSAVDGNNRERNNSHRDDERHRYRDDRRDDRRDNRTHPAQRNRDRDHHSRDDENDRGRPTRTRQASPENDHRSGSKYEERYRRDDRDRRRRSRSRSDDDDDEKRERKRSRKKSSHRKHEKRDRKHSRHREVRHHKERDSGSRHRRRSPSSSV